jgi:hypothetical protein
VRRIELDDHVLVGNLVAGNLFLVPLLFLAPLPAVIGGAYVAVASVVLAAAYGRATLTRRQEALSWLVTWAGAVAAWVAFLAILTAGEGEDPEATGSWIGAAAWMGLVCLVIGTVCFLVWQATALAVRRVLGWGEDPSDDLRE